MRCHMTAVVQVRAAAVFALGTFLNSCSNRTEHANALDQATLFTFLEGLGHEMELNYLD
jgi:regulator-associated protein of mTOR